ncbi:type II toxin-antitoxin system PemK/MazF family toxin [Enterocloster clostridioformis]|uniref:type II toxin-antitoxin system PemK/MazF family toxin n=1 Tax=Enterocloster clostridioformis TaxID=1531 RepID=UPI00080C9AC8|nr:type II toxin-antitoxin system PemK/MazF family toxin [Enterocloster clostridioformis]QQR01395.1 type II toxin-antitoxin system PemK/MazF family toxin [Enterocloster clostridioformis]
MKNTATLEDASHSYGEMLSALHGHFSHINPSEPEHIKLANEYYKWTHLKTDLILNEKSFRWLHADKQETVGKYYRYDRETDQYIISVKKDTVPDDDVMLIARSLVLIRKAVVWVDFGYNIGTEFGGRHPAIILKNLRDSLVVIPLSSQVPKNMEYSVRVDKVYGFPEMPRYANVTRITQVSLSRVHFEKFGDVRPAVLKEISDRLKSCGIT